MRRRGGRLGPTLAVALLCLLFAPAAGDEEEDVVVRLRPLRGFDVAAPERTRFGSLEWLGGAELSSGDRRFRGFSGLILRDDRFLAVSDNGDWLSARLVVDAAGRPVALEEARIRRLRGDGRPLRGKRGGDAEAVALRQTAAGAEILVSLESPGHILAYPGDEPVTRPRRIAFPPALASAPPNGRGEALVVVPSGPHAGALLTFAENPREGASQIAGALLVGDAWRPLALAASGGYAVTDAAFLPSGDLLVLERRFGFTTGVGMRIRRIAGADIVPGAVLDGPVVVEADLGQEIDNMEAIAVDRDARGTVVTLMSDDNGSMLQRTLLLRFRLVGE